MGFEVGHKKTGGRKKGTPNRSSQTTREIVEAALGGSIPDRLIEIALTHPQLELDILTALMPYCYAKLAAIEHSGEVKNAAAGDTVQALAEELLRISGPPR